MLGVSSTVLQSLVNGGCARGALRYVISMKIAGLWMLLFVFAGCKHDSDNATPQPSATPSASAASDQPPTEWRQHHRRHDGGFGRWRREREDGGAPAQEKDY